MRETLSIYDSEENIDIHNFAPIQSRNIFTHLYDLEENSKM